MKKGVKEKVRKVPKEKVIKENELLYRRFVY